MSVEKESKRVRIQVIGFIKEELVEQYLTDLQTTVSSVPKTEYTFVVDATEQSPLPSKVSAGLGETIMFYVSFGFKDYIIVNSKSKIATVQIRNALEGIPYPGIVVDKL